MPQIEVSEDMLKQLSAFRKIMDIILEQSSEDLSYYAQIVLNIGMERMLADVLPPEEEYLRKTMVAILRDNPEYLCDFVARMLSSGEKEDIEKLEIAKESWGYIR